MSELKKLSMADAKAKLVELLQGLEKDQAFKAYVEYWGDVEGAGIRIAEIGAIIKTHDGGMSGGCMFQTQQETAAIFYWAERYVLDLMHFPEDAGYSEEMLRDALKED